MQRSAVQECHSLSRFGLTAVKAEMVLRMALASSLNLLPREGDVPSRVVSRMRADITNNVRRLREISPTSPLTSSYAAWMQISQSNTLQAMQVQSPTPSQILLYLMVSSGIFKLAWDCPGDFQISSYSQR